jgi:uncharacterized protein YdeI (YjbR/CyaY-like superfamily)
MSRELALALEQEPVAKATWEAASATKRKDVLGRLARLRTQESVVREIEKLVEKLNKGKL